MDHVWVAFHRLIISTVFFSFPQSQLFTKKILCLVNRVGNIVGHTKKLYERPSVLKTRSLSMVLDRQVPSRIGNKSLEYQGSKVTLPSTQELIGDNDKNKTYLTQVRLATVSTVYTTAYLIFDTEGTVRLRPQIGKTNRSGRSYTND